MAASNQSAATTLSSYAAALSSNITAQDPYYDLMTRFRSSVTVVPQTNPRSTRQTSPFYLPYGSYIEDYSSSDLPRMGYTENHSRTYLETGNPCLDFFFHVVPTTKPETLTEYLKSAWTQDPCTTLKLICNLRGVRGTGKSDKEGFYTAALWLHNNHPATLACNLAAIAEFGYFKDFPEILHRILQGSDVRKKAKESRPMKYSRQKKTVERFGRRGRRTVMISRRNLMRKWRKEEKARNMPNIVASREERVLAAEQKDQEAAAAARELRKEKKRSAAKKVLHLLSCDPDFEVLYDCITSLFSDHLKSDIENLNSGNINQISLAAKWCPSLDSSYDQTTLLCESIARKIFPKESDPEYESLEDAHYAYRVRDRLRKEVLVPLRKALELPEVYIGKNSWGSIPYNRVASVAMNFYKEKFLKHDKERFEEYLGKVEAGKAKIAAGALLPHNIIASLEDGDGGRVAEVQWKRMVADMAKEGKLRNCLAVCDVSGSMSGTPMEVSIALGVLVSELSDAPWKGKVITFSESPTLQIVTGKNLKEKVEFVRGMDWGGNTDFQKVFDMILAVAVKANLRPDQMVKKVFVFSDMEFDQASSNPWETDYRAIERKFYTYGYGEAMPEIVFWNLRASRATPVPADESGVALISGYSKNLMKLFMKESGVIDPEFVMKAAISGEEYQGLFVFD